MSSSSCSRCSRETLYCSSRTSAKYSVLRIDSFSFTVRMMSCGHRGTGVTEERASPHIQAQSGEDSPDLPSAPPCCQGEKGPCWLGPLPIQEANLDGPQSPLQGPVPTALFPSGLQGPPRMAALSGFTWEAEAIPWGLTPLFKVSRSILYLESALSIAYQT